MLTPPDAVGVVPLLSTTAPELPADVTAPVEIVTPPLAPDRVVPLLSTTEPDPPMLDE